MSHQVSTGACEKRHVEGHLLEDLLPGWQLSAGLAADRLSTGFVGWQLSCQQGLLLTGCQQGLLLAGCQQGLTRSTIALYKQTSTDRRHWGSGQL